MRKALEFIVHCRPAGLAAETFTFAKALVLVLLLIEGFISESENEGN